MKKAVLASVIMIAGAFLAPAFAQDAADIILRLDRLESENRRLNGQIEEMRFQLRRSEDQLKRFQTDADTRFRDLESARPGARPGTTPSTQTPPAPRRSDAFDPAQNPNAAGAPRPLTPGTDPNAPIDVTQPRRTVAVTDGKGDPKSDYEAAQAHYANGDYERSEIAFRDFAKNHAKDRRVPDAIFFQGESLLARTRYREAAEHYLTVTSKHATASRAPEAMLKLGLALRGLGAKPEACATFDQVPKKYPNASSEIKAAVTREKARASC